MKNLKSLLAFGLMGSLCFGQTVTTDPVGVVTWDVQAGTGTSRILTALSLPLYAPSTSLTGNALGVINGVTSDTITVTDAGWAVGELSASATPYCIRITSGAAEGQVLLISTNTDNTADTLTIDLANSNVSDLTDLGIVTTVNSEDTFEVIECDTLANLFGEAASGGVIGGNTLEDGDIIYLFVQGAWAKFYYDLDIVAGGRWTEFRPGFPDSSNQVVLPDSAILYSRLADEASQFVITGTVPTTDRHVTVNNLGLTPLGSSYPVDVAISEFGFENIPGWVSSADGNVADFVYILSSGTWARFYFDGTDWREFRPGIPVSNDEEIGAGSAVLLSKKVATTNDSLFVQSIPYDLNL